MWLITQMLLKHTEKERMRGHCWHTFNYNKNAILSLYCRFQIYKITYFVFSSLFCAFICLAFQFSQSDTVFQFHSLECSLEVLVNSLHHFGCRPNIGPEQIKKRSVTMKSYKQNFFIYCALLYLYFVRFRHFKFPEERSLTLWELLKYELLWLKTYEQFVYCFRVK